MACHAMTRTHGRKKDWHKMAHMCMLTQHLKEIIKTYLMVEDMVDRHMLEYTKTDASIYEKQYYRFSQNANLII